MKPTYYGETDIDDGSAKTPPTSDEPDLTIDPDLLKNLDVISGLSGIEFTMEHTDKGSYQATYENGRIHINIDPHQVRGNGDTATMTEKALFIASHELLHAIDTLAEGVDPNVTPSDHFFKNLIDDTVNDKKLSRRPVIGGQRAEAIYSDTLPQDLTNMPEAVQLMYAIRFAAVTPNAEIAIKPEILALVDGLRTHQVDDTTYDIIEALTDPRTTLAERRVISKSFIYPVFQELVKKQKQKSQPMKAVSILDHAIEELTKPKKGDDQSPDLTKQIVVAIRQQQADKRLQKRKNQQAEAAADKAAAEKERESNIQGLIEELDPKLHQPANVVRAYAEAIEDYHQIIDQVAKVFMRLAAPTETVNSPRFTRQPVNDGSRLHPRRLPQAVIEGKSGQPQRIWQTAELIGRSEAIDFGGIDIHLLIDASGSMSWNNSLKALCAANSAVCLTEGLATARARVGRQAGIAQPDVRIQITTFSDHTDIVSPLSFQPSDQQKGQMFAEVVAAKGKRTQVTGAVETVQSVNRQSPRRRQLVFVVTDGEFDDYAAAKSLVDQLPKSAVSVKQINIGGDTATPLSQTETISSPEELPAKLLTLLRQEIQ